LAPRNRLAPGHLKVEEKSDEITAVPELLQALNLKGCVMTLDALNTA
jgi:predicted transposase YbfD/YdcC